MLGRPTSTFILRGVVCGRGPLVQLHGLDAGTPGQHGGAPARLPLLLLQFDHLISVGPTQIVCFVMQISGLFWGILIHGNSSFWSIGQTLYLITTRILALVICRCQLDLLLLFDQVSDEVPGQRLHVHPGDQFNWISQNCSTEFWRLDVAPCGTEEVGYNDTLGYSQKVSL